MDRPNDEPTESPTNTSDQADAEGAWMATNWIAVAIVSIGFTLLLVLGMMQWSGMIDVLAPFTGSEGGQWIAFGIVALAVLIVAAWSWTSVIGSSGGDDETSTHQ